MKEELKLKEMNKDELNDLIDEYKKKIEEVERQIVRIEKEETGYEIGIGDVFLHIHSNHDALNIIRIKSDTYRDPTRHNSIVYITENITSNIKYESPSIRNIGMYRDEILSQYEKIDPEHFEKIHKLFNEYVEERTEINEIYHRLMTETIKEKLS